MRKLNSWTISILLTTTLIAPATLYARYDKGDAKNDCKYKIRSNDHYSNFHDVNTEDKGHHSFKVTGKVKSDRDGKNHYFNCKIRHGEVTSWSVSPNSAHRDNKNNNNTAAAVGVGILGIAAIVAASRHDDDKEHNSRRDSYYSGSGGNPFDDITYLRKQCKRELHGHLKEDHGRINKIKFNHVDLHNRRLRGNGWVDFRHGGKRDLTFNCKFDRSGRIHDGNYSYTSKNDDYYNDEYSSSNKGVPEIRTRHSGEIEVIIPPGGCVALYDRRGDLISHGNSCDRQDRHRAKEAVRTYLNEQ